MFKHAVWLQALLAALADPRPLEVIDTHAGAGIYDLDAAPPRRTGEAEAGVGRLLADPAPPAPMQPLVRAVRALNGGAEGPLYPGSPWLTAQALRPGDRLVACELREDDHAALTRALVPALTPAHTPAHSPALAGRSEARLVDGYAAARAARPGARRLVLIDPPFERGDEAAQVVEALKAVLRRGEAAVVWLPLKDLDGLDRTVAAVEALHPQPSLLAQVRLRPLDDPLRLNGCALLLVGLDELAAVIGEIARYVASLGGGEGATARVDRLGG